MAEEEVISVSYKTFMKQLEEYNKQIPNVATKLMRAVNNKAKASIRKEAKARGYSAHSFSASSSYDSGYSANLKSYANRDFSGKITFLKNGFYYRFLEAGTGERYTKGKAYRGFIAARPFIKPISASFWETSKGSDIMEKAFQKELYKYFKD